MGMAASQARYLGLVARQNDLEYQGQQINQERTVLSQQVTDLYNALQNLTVPTPPSTTDFSKVEYTGTSGATTYTFDASSVKPEANNLYTVTLAMDKYGNGLEQKKGYATVNGMNVGGGQAMTLAEALKSKKIDQGLYDGYVDAINNSGVKNAKGEPCTPEEFYIIIFEDADTEPQFALISDVVGDNNNNAITYTYVANAKQNKKEVHEHCELKFDPSNGRITSISIPNYDAEGNLISKTEIEVEAKNITDEAAYKDAYAQYEYDKNLYDKAQSEINAKTEVIQQQDKKLELKLTRLDNERTQITTEIEAVQKVINDNIESSYKTFSG